MLNLNIIIYIYAYLYIYIYIFIACITYIDFIFTILYHIVDKHYK